MRLFNIILLSPLLLASCALAFSVVNPSSSSKTGLSRFRKLQFQQPRQTLPSGVTTTTSSSPTALFMSEGETQTKRRTGRSTAYAEEAEPELEEETGGETDWRVILHNDEVHTFHYVVRTLTRVVGTLDRKAAFEVCVEAHGSGKGTITKTWKKQAEQYAVSLQRQGLTVSMAPDQDHAGGHGGGGQS
eukprot:CAMPEP_0116848462 /NCGR_PEP_ID=MMETSP0418-20121206/15010_1 /TAXON_ID=1158023 /ORGANISM="Astrosyne radiata, Strain 13vi08-1A" /LENGTH=187 /DNA_ID=CAMNT_0004480035 /DNA_START=62 /DNA_END=625 /DNA_ORIENTATION=+